MLQNFSRDVIFKNNKIKIKKFDSHPTFHNFISAHLYYTAPNLDKLGT